jgi:MFS family permease
MPSIKGGVNHHSAIMVILTCHFISALSTLGLAPFYGTILSQSFQLRPSIFIGFIYILPTLLTAISIPLWGKLSDKINKKSALLRAQIGLTISFVIAAFSQGNILLFIFSLIIQGIFGGTLAAANAYLAKAIKQVNLSILLNLTQYSARLAFVCGPIIVGLLFNQVSIFTIYMLLAVITAISVVMVSVFIPNDKNINGNFTNKHQKITNNPSQNLMPNISYGTLLIGNFIISLSLVATFPYFILLLRDYYQVQSTIMAGIIFSIPHLAYLVLMFSLQNKLLILQHQKRLFYVSIIGLAMSILLQVVTKNLELLIVFRFFMGICMICVYSSLNKLISEIKMNQKEGAVFGWLDSFNKYGGVFGGVCAGILFSLYDARSPFVFAGVALLFYCVLSSKVINKSWFYLYSNKTIQARKRSWRIL